MIFWLLFRVFGASYYRVYQHFSLGFLSYEVYYSQGYLIEKDVKWLTGFIISGFVWVAFKYDIILPKSLTTDCASMHS